MILTLWRDVRQAYYDAVKAWVRKDNSGAALMLRLAIKRSETLIAYLEREEKRNV